MLRFIATIIFLLFCIQHIRSQQAEFYFHKNGIQATLDTITYKEFSGNGHPVSWIEPVINPRIDSIVTVMRVRYPSAIKDSLKYTLLYSNEGVRYLWNDSTNADASRLITWEKLNFKNGWLIFRIAYSQGMEYVLFNPKTHELRSLRGFPVMEKDNAYTIGSYDGEYFFEFKSLVNDASMQLISNSWVLSSFYRANGKFYFEFSRNEKKKWLRIS